MQRQLVCLLSTAILLGACSDSADDTETGQTPQTTDASGEPPSSGPEETLTEEEAADMASSSTAPETTVDEAEESNDQPEETGEPTGAERSDVERLCDSYLTYLAQNGIDELAVELGADAPPGVVDAINVIRTSDDFLDILLASNDLAGYVAPICRDRWDEGLVPAATDEEAVNRFFDAIVLGDRPTAEELAPADVRANFEPWMPLEDDPELGPPTMDYAGGGDFIMLLEPTVSVFCIVEGGIVTSCTFGE